MPQHRNPWHQHGGMYRSVNDLTVPWVASPVSDAPDLSFGASSGSIHLKPVVNINPPVIINRRSRCRLGRMIESWRRKDVQIDDAATARKFEGPLPRILPHEWKAWGYYHRPTINGVVVNNTSPPTRPSFSNIDAQDVFENLRSPNGTPHPERWVPGLVHPAIPPRPTRWTRPKPGDPLPFPWECQLNPFIEHRQYGTSALCWDIGQSPSAILYGKPRTTIPLSAADKTQPASWPFLTHMFINAIAEDTAPRFLWPVMVHNPNGINCEDVFNQIYENFQQHVAGLEFDTWHPLRQRQALWAYQTRRRTDPEEALRRIDYLGHLVMFRGLEANPDGQGWVLFVGLA